MRTWKPFNMPAEIWQAAEKIAQERRQLTGQMVRWTDIIHEILRKALTPRTRRTRRPKPE